MKKHLVTFVLAACAYFIPVHAIAGTIAPENLTDSDCSKEILLSYFPEIFVRETLVKFNVPKDKWESIVKELSEKNKTVINAVEEKASKLSQSPLKDPQQRQAAVKLFRETILEIFSGVMKNNGVTDEKQIQAMLDDVQQQTARRFALCIKRSEDTAKADVNSDNEDEFDEEDEEDEEDDSDDYLNDEENSSGKETDSTIKVEDSEKKK